MILGLNGGRGRNRTYNLSIKSRMLCQLSYASRNTPKGDSDAIRKERMITKRLEKYNTSERLI